VSDQWLRCEDCRHDPDHHLPSAGCYCGCQERFAAAPSPAPTADEAWEALDHEFGSQGEWIRDVIARHRPAIEAAIRGREAGLDVERLARAVWTWRYGDRLWQVGGQDEGDTTYMAEHMAREYARLSETP
jgi:hypothetical protein